MKQKRLRNSKYLFKSNVKTIVPQEKAFEEGLGRAGNVVLPGKAFGDDPGKAFEEGPGKAVNVVLSGKAFGDDPGKAFEEGPGKAFGDDPERAGNAVLPEKAFEESTWCPTVG